MTKLPQPPQPNRPIPAVLYAAKSTKDRRGSIETQLSDARIAAEREGREVAGDYRDENKSAYTGSRGPGLEAARDQAARLAAEHGGSELWVQHSDRLARGDGLEAAHLVEYVLWARKAGVTLRSLQDGATFGDMIHAVLMGERNTEDSRRKSEATRAGKRRRFEDGKVVGGPVHDGYRLAPETTPNGLPVIGRDGRVSYRRERDPDRGPIVERIFDLVQRGLTYGDVQRRLNAEGLRTRPSKRHPDGARWTTRHVRETVQNAYYAGWVIAHGERRRGEHQALIDPDRFEEILQIPRRLDPATVQRRKGGRQPAEPYILRGVAFCSRCGDSMYTKRYARLGGRAYVCRNVRESTGLCHAPPIPASAIESHVLAHLDHLIPHVEGWVAERAAERRGESANLERAVATERGDLARLERDVGLLRKDHLRHLRAGHERRADLVLAEMERADAQRDAQAAEVARTEARLSEWDVTPSAVDSALDFYSEVTALIRGRIRQAASAVELNAALADLLVGVWMSVETTGLVNADFSLRTTEAAGTRLVGFHFYPSSTLGLPAWLSSAEPDGERCCDAAPRH